MVPPLVLFVGVISTRVDVEVFMEVFLSFFCLGVMVLKTKKKLTAMDPKMDQALAHLFYKAKACGYGPVCSRVIMYNSIARYGLEEGVKEGLGIIAELHNTCYQLDALMTGFQFLSLGISSSDKVVTWYFFSLLLGFTFSSTASVLSIFIMKYLHALKNEDPMFCVEKVTRLLPIAAVSWGCTFLGFVSLQTSMNLMSFRMIPFWTAIPLCAFSGIMMTFVVWCYIYFFVLAIDKGEFPRFSKQPGHRQVMRERTATL